MLLVLGAVIHEDIVLDRAHPQSESAESDRGLSASLRRIERQRELFKADQIAKELGLQLVAQRTTHGTKLINGTLKRGRYSQYRLAPTGDSYPASNVENYVVFIADDDPSITSSELVVFPLGCVTKTQLEQALGPLVPTDALEGRWSTTLTKAPNGNGAMRIELGMQRCLREFRLTQDTVAHQAG